MSEGSFGERKKKEGKIEAKQMFKGSRPRIETRAQSEYSYRDREPHEKKDEALPAELEKDDHSSFFKTYYSSIKREQEIPRERNSAYPDKDYS